MSYYTDDLSMKYRIWAIMLWASLIQINAGAPRLWKMTEPCNYAATTRPAPPSGRCPQYPRDGAGTGGFTQIGVR